MAEDATGLGAQDMTVGVLLLGLFLNEAFYVAVFTFYGEPVSSVIHLTLTLLLTALLVYLGYVGVEMDLSWNEWIRQQWFEWYNFFTTRHYTSWLFSKKPKAWLKVIIMVAYPISAGIIFLIVGSFSLFPNHETDIGILYLLIANIFIPFCVLAAIWLLWNVYKELNF